MSWPVSLLFFAFTLALPQSEQADAALARALQLHQAGDMEGAVRAYQEFLKDRPGNAEVHSNLGAALARLGRYEEAIAQYQNALAQSANNSVIRLNLALAYYKSASIRQAATELASVVAQQPANKKAVFLLADCLLRMGQNKQVIHLLAPLESANLEDPAFDYLLGTALIRDEQVPKGQVLIDRILRNGDSAEARLLMGTVQLLARDYTAGLKDLRRAVELNPKLPDVHSYYGQALLATGDTAGAAHAFRQELTANPNDFESNLNLGALLRQDQNYEEALRYLKRALQLRPGSPPVRYQIASIYLAEGKTEAAQQELEQVVKETPGFLEAHVSLATVYYRLKRKQDGDRERALVEKIMAARQSEQPGAKAQ